MASEHWEFYLCQIDEAPGSILVDMGVAALAPVADLPFVAVVRVQLPMCTLEGLAVAEELEELRRLEDHLVTVLPRTGAARYVGRSTASGYRDFFFYTAKLEDWEGRATAAMLPFNAFPFVAEVRVDRGWQIYLEFLHPSDHDLHRIKNRHVCDVLHEHGDALTAPREIEHWAYFPDAASRARFLAMLETLEFTVRALWDEQGEPLPCGVRFARIDVPSFSAIDELTLPLYQAALDAGGDYDGWETQVVRAAQSLE